ncbi:hypothetical protein L1887_03622 [Cichorium endivia]|nr:hypothetical protein L1887_03622 [Cichorium endivia]
MQSRSFCSSAGGESSTAGEPKSSTPPASSTCSGDSSEFFVFDKESEGRVKQTLPEEIHVKSDMSCSLVSPELGTTFLSRRQRITPPKSGILRCNPPHSLKFLDSLEWQEIETTIGYQIQSKC